MTGENQVKLLTAYRLATIARQHDIADLLGEIILSEMKPRPATALRGYHAEMAILDDMPPVPAHGSMSVTTCELGKEVTS